MYDIDRALIIVRPKQPFFDWVQSVDRDEDLTLEYIREDPTAYLVPEPLDKDEQAEILKWCYEIVFEEELEMWYIDPAVWPQDRDQKMFLEWFDIEFHTLVFDLCHDPIHVIDYGSEENGEPNSMEAEP